MKIQTKKKKKKKKTGARANRLKNRDKRKKKKKEKKKQGATAVRIGRFHSSEPARHGSAAQRPSLVRLQCLFLELYRMVLPVRIRIHCGSGRFCFCFFASLSLIRSVLWLGCGGGRNEKYIYMKNMKKN
jgi:hypothetical protein